MKSFILWIHSMVSLLLLSAAAASTTTTPFDGTYKLVDLYDQDFQQISLADGPSYKCILRCTEEEEDEDGTIQLQFLLYIGNDMMGSVTILHDDKNDNERHAKIQIRRIASTKIMPTDPVWRVEMALASVLPKLNQMDIIYDGRLEMKGNQEGGKLVLKALED
jgi:hypothetical protein